MIYYSHLEHCRELEIARDKCVSDNLTLRTQLETLSQTLEKQDALLAEKVCGVACLLCKRDVC